MRDMSIYLKKWTAKHERKDKIKQFELDMVKILISASFLICSQLLLAQFTNTGLTIGVSSGTTISGQEFNSSGSLTNDGTMIFSGDFASTSYAGSGVIYLTGAGQMIDLGGPSDLNTLTIDGGGTKSLNSVITITNALQFINGKIDAAVNNLVVGSTASISGSSSSNYVIGKLIHQGTGDKFFPVGDAILYTPVNLIGTTGTTPEVGVELVNSDPAGTVGFGIVDLSQIRYWEITEENGTYDGAQMELPTIGESVIANQSEGVVAGTGPGGDVFRSFGSSANTGDPSNGTITSNDLIGPGKVAIGKFFDEQLRVNDSTALVNIYNQTGGIDWANSSGWTIDSLDNWFGVIMENKRVKSLTLPSNALTGTFPTIATGLEDATDINISDNELTEVNALSNQASLVNLNVDANRLQFGTLESLLADPYTTSYLNQKTVLDRERVLKQIGEEHTVDRTVSGSANTYSWFDGADPISESGPTFTLTDLTFEDEGEFRTEVTNTNVPGLTLTTEEVVLRVSSLERDSTSLIAMYDALGGENWAVGSDWPTTPISSWDGNGITLGSNRVTGIDLSSNNLSGSVPEDVIDLGQVSSINLAGNEITSLPDMTSLPNLTTFNVENNKLTFGSLEPNASILSTYAPQSAIGEEFETQIDKGQSFLLTFEVDGEENNYSWLRDTSRYNQAFQGVPITEADQSSLLIENIDFVNMGEHRLRVQNTLLPDLTLESETQTVWAQADIDFTPIYNNLIDQPAPLDEGEGWLFEIIPEQPYDSVFTEPTLIDGNGLSFQDVRLGDYLVFVRTDTLLLRDVNGEVDSVQVLPTYFESTIDWAEADVLELRDFVDDSLFMQQQPRPLTDKDGDGIVRLLVESDFADESSGRIEARRRVQKAGCSLRRRTTGGGGRPDQDEEYVLIAYKETDEEGRVSFGFLPTGFYRLNIQYPGIPMDTTSFVEFEIEEDQEEGGFELEADVTEEGIFVRVIEALGFYRKYFKDLNVYPVPADQTLSIAYDKLNSDGVEVRLVDLRGQTVRQVSLQKGYQRSIQLDVHDVEGGVYLLYFVDKENPEKNIVFYKVIVRH